MTFRARQSLDGQWLFWADPHAAFSPRSLAADEARTVVVPAPWQSQAAELRFYSGTGWYRRGFTVPAGWDRQPIMLCFAAVDFAAEVWVNDTRLGSHEGGYLPFEFDISGAVRPGENELTVRVVDDAEAFTDTPHGKQSWYGVISGIWQSVTLESRPRQHLTRLAAFPDAATGRLRAQVVLALDAASKDAIELAARVQGPDGQPAGEARRAVAADGVTSELELSVPEPRLWSPEHPHLYRLAVDLLVGGEVVDSLETACGFRTIETRDGQLLLNGEPVYLRAALDQDYYPGTIYTTPSSEFLEDEFRKAKELGLNCLRCHIKVADPRYYEVADRLGLLIWTELPNWQMLTERARQDGRALLEGIVARDGNHPSIIIWTIINESWGADLVHDAAQRAWLKEMYGWLKALDPTRLVVDNSPCFPNFHIQTDLDDFHFYKVIPDHRKGWDRFVRQYASRPAWTFSPHGDAVRTFREPLILSEFGNWGLPDPDGLVDEDGQEPWWFETGSEWDQGIVYPHGIHERYAMWHLDRVFADWRSFIEATQWHQYQALKYEIEVMRRQESIVGYVITELTDVHWECNGLLDMCRRPKAFARQFGQINANTVVIPAWKCVTSWAGQPVQIEPIVAHGAGPALAGTTLHWEVAGVPDSGGEISVPDLAPGRVQPLTPLAFRAPELPEAGTAELQLRLAGPDGRRIASNHLAITVFPLREGPAGGPQTSLWTPDPDIADWLADLGYNLATDMRSASAVVYDRLDDAMRYYVRDGGRLLLMATNAKALPREGFEGLQVVSREDTVWYGDWATSFSWLRREGPFGRLPGGPLLDASFDATLSEFVLYGFRPWEFEAHVHAGLFVGWIHKPVALIGERRYGDGRMVLNTLRLFNGYAGLDPVATTLLDALIELTLK